MATGALSYVTSRVSANLTETDTRRHTHITCPGGRTDRPSGVRTVRTGGPLPRGEGKSEGWRYLIWTLQGASSHSTRPYWSAGRTCSISWTRLARPSVLDVGEEQRDGRIFSGRLRHYYVHCKRSTENVIEKRSLHAVRIYIYNVYNIYIYIYIYIYRRVV